MSWSDLMNTTAMENISNKHWFIQNKKNRTKSRLKSFFLLLFTQYYSPEGII